MKSKRKTEKKEQLRTLLKKKEQKIVQKSVGLDDLKRNKYPIW